jgi:hypothetical protein
MAGVLLRRSFLLLVTLPLYGEDHERGDLAP